MDLDDAQKLPHGVYRLYWTEDEGGGSSLAVVGSMYSGKRWFACANWTGRDSKGIPGSDNARYWAKIERAELIKERPVIDKLEKFARAFLAVMALMFLSAWGWAYYGGSDELSAGASLGLIWTVFPLAIREERR